jgi:two-component system sensor histidine kinase KdpD
VAVIFLPGENGRIDFRRRTAERLPVSSHEESVAQWVFEHAQQAGRGTSTLPDASATYWPLRGATGCEGVLAVISPAARPEFSDEQSDLLEIFAGQIALALGRARSNAEAGEAELRATTERLRNSLLSALSHDLRTPLASITGAASTLLDQGEQLERATRRELVESIADEAERLTRLVNNLLEMTKLESGAIKLNRDWHPLDEILGAALRRLERLLHGREVRVEAADDAPMARVDDVLFEEVFQNLIENAVKHTAPGTPIDIFIRPGAGGLVLEVADRGAGFTGGEETRIFDKFYRGKNTGARGAGLGLTICRAIVEAHGGTISAHNREGGGAVLRVRLPLGGTPPQLETSE